MGNLKPRAPHQYPSGRAPQRDKALAIRKLRRLFNEDKREAMARASREPWWPRVVNAVPVLSCGAWCWQARAG
jgi:hypothetical protein